jgi:hypothetical protein
VWGGDPFSQRGEPQGQKHRRGRGAGRDRDEIDQTIFLLGLEAGRGSWEVLGFEWRMERERERRNKILGMVV